MPYRISDTYRIRHRYVSCEYPVFCFFLRILDTWADTYRASGGAASREGSSGVARPAGSERRAACGEREGGEALAAAAGFLLGGRWPDGAGDGG